MSFAFKVSILEVMSSDVSCSRIERALEGEDDTTACMCRFARILRSSIEIR
jgi:hypothetical protein